MSASTDQPQLDSRSCYCCFYGKSLDSELEANELQPDCYCCFYGKSLDLEPKKLQLDSTSRYYCFCGDPQIKKKKEKEVNYNRWAKHACQIFNCFCSKSKCCCNYFKVKENQWDHLEPNLSRFFNSLHYFYIWLVISAIVGIIMSIFSIYTILSTNPALMACDSPFENYYMCPTCSKGCDFWYFKQFPLNVIPCSRRFRLLLDNLLYGFIVLWYSVVPLQ